MRSVEFPRRSTDKRPPWYHLVTSHIAATPRSIQRSAAIRIIIAAVGFAPVTALAVAIFGFAELPTTVTVMVLPGAVALAELLWLKRNYRAIALSGFVFGLIAVALYDLFRVPFIMSGLWGDFIPSIGTWLVPDGNPHPVIGYLYRYIGDGGGMGMGFVALYPLLHRLVRNPIACGIGYGLAVWSGLLATLFLAPRGQELLFRATPLILTLSGTGHVIYGAVLGTLIRSRRAAALPGVGGREDFVVSTLTSS